MSSSPGAASAARGARSLLWPEQDSHPAHFTHVGALAFRSSPLLLAALGFAGGILLAHWWQPASALVVMTALLIAVAAAAVRLSALLALPATAIVWLALGWTCATLHAPPAPSLALLPYADSLSRDVEGVIVRVQQVATEHADETEPEWSAQETADHSSAATLYSVDLAVSAIEEVTPDTARMVAASGGVRMSLTATAEQSASPACGTVVRIPLRLHPPQRFLDPGVWQYPEYLAGQGISLQASSALDHLHTLHRAAPLPFACRLQMAKNAAEQRLASVAAYGLILHMPRTLQLSTADTAALQAMLLGDRSQLAHSLRTQFERTGVFHLFVVAGFHVALLAAALYGLLRRVRAPAWLATSVALLLTLTFAVFSGFGEPVQRALLMTAAFMLVRLLSRRGNTLNALSLAALTMLVLKPEALFDSALQMTLLVIVAIGGIATPLWQRSLWLGMRATQQLGLVALDTHLPPRLAQLRVSLRMLCDDVARLFGRRAWPVPALLLRALLWWCELTVVAVVTELVMALPMALYFHRITPLALPANLLVTPLAGLLLGAAIVTLALAMLHPLLALLPAMATAALLHLTSAIVRGLGSLQAADLRTPAPAAWAVAVALLCWSIAVWAERRHTRLAGALPLLLLPLATALLLWPRPPRFEPGSLGFTAVDVGQGDSLLVTAPDGAAMLIDAGGPTGSARAPAGAAAMRTAAFDIGEQVVSPFLWSRGVRRLDVLVLTHAHSDHMGGMPAVLRNFRPRELWLSVQPPSPELTALLRQAVESGVTIRRMRAGSSVQWHGVDVDALGPAPAYQPAAAPANNDSLVLRLRYGHASVLAEGDAERTEEFDLLAHNIAPVTLLKVGHHGSRSSTAPELLSQLRPQQAVISCGRRNRFGHPRPEVLLRLGEQHAVTWRTDLDGAVQFLLRADGSIRAQSLASNTWVR